MYNGYPKSTRANNPVYSPNRYGITFIVPTKVTDWRLCCSWGLLVVTSTLQIYSKGTALVLQTNQLHSMSSSVGVNSQRSEQA